MTWSESTVLHTTSSRFVFPPEVLTDLHGVVHAFWTELDLLPEREYAVRHYHTSAYDGIWEEPRVLFMDHKGAPMPFKMAMQDNGTIHVAYGAADGHLYHAQFR